MIEWFAWLQAIVAGAVALVAFGFALGKKTPNDYTLGGTLVVGVLLGAQIVVSIVAPFVGNNASGDGLEYWMYLVTAVLMIPAALVWSLVERTVVSNVVLGVVAASVSVMVVRMHQIWFINSA